MIFLKDHRLLCRAKTIGRTRRLCSREDMAATCPGCQLWSCWQVMGSGCCGVNVPVPAPHTGTVHVEANLSTFLWWGSGEPAMLTCCWWEWKTVQPFWRGIWQHQTKLHIRQFSDPTVLLGIYHEDIPPNMKIHVHTVTYWSIICNWKILETP